MKILVVGEAPSRWMEENNVTVPLPLARSELARLAGIIPQRFDELFECTNVLDSWPGKQGKGDAFPLAAARASASKMLDRLWGRRVVLLGRRVEMAFGFEKTPVPLLEWREALDPSELQKAFTLTPTSSSIRIYHYAVCPHPSGINTWWNKAENRRAAAVFWGDLVPQGARP